MKKSLLYCSALLVLGFAACDDKSDLGVMQTNPQETIMSADGVSVSIASQIESGSVNLEQLGADYIIPVLS